jgi:hypothetical protein
MPSRHVLDWQLNLIGINISTSRVGLSVESKRSDHAITSRVGLAVLAAYVTITIAPRASVDTSPWMKQLLNIYPLFELTDLRLIVTKQIISVISICNA